MMPTLLDPIRGAYGLVHHGGQLHGKPPQHKWRTDTMMRIAMIIGIALGQLRQLPPHWQNLGIPDVGQMPQE
jgi:hypothetical protein